MNNIDKDINKDKEVNRLKKRISGLEKTLKIVSDYSGRVENNLKQLFEDLSSTIPVPLIIFSFDNDILFVNEKAQEIFGFNKEIFYKLNILDLFENTDDITNLLNELTYKKDLKINSIKLVKADKSLFPVSIVIRQITFEGQKCLLTVIYDLTEIKEEEKKRLILEKRLMQKYKMEAIGTLAGGIAHDLNNVLSGILGFAQLSLSRIKEDEKLISFIKGIYEAGIRARDLVKNILTFSRLNKDNTFKPIQIQYIIKEVVKLITATFPPTIKIESNIQSDSIIMCDSSQIHQVLMNVSINACHAMRNKGGTCEIHLNDFIADQNFCSLHPELVPGNYLKITIKDTGTGIPPEIIEKIFDPFFTTKDINDGNGLGLSVVHGIVENHSGAIIVNSEINKGTSFEIFFPIIKNELKNKTKKTNTIKDVRGKEHILYVDDEKMIVEMSKEMLTKAGYKITTTTSSLDALSIFKQNSSNIDLVILDMIMPDMDGKQLAIELMKIKPKIPIIMSTGYSDMINEKKALELGIKVFIMKPILKAEMINAINKALNNNS